MDTQTAKRPPRGASQHAALWHRVLHDPHLRDLPYKVETNQHGQIVLSPHKTYHSNFQGCLIRLLIEHLPRGNASPEYPIATSGGVKVCDVVWLSAERAAEVPEDAEASPVAPEICVEVLSGSNTQSEMEDKRRLYFEAGAEEVWIVSTKGAIAFYDAGGALPASKRAKTFPGHIEA